MKYVLLLPALALSLSVSACVQNDLTLTLNRYVAPTAESCEVAPSNQFLISKGILDVGLVASLGTGGYVAFPEIQNNLPAGAGGTNSIQLNAITVTALDVELIPSEALEGALPGAARGPFRIAVAGGRLTPAGLVVVSAEVVPRQVVDAVAPAVSATATSFPILTASVRPVGNRSGSEIVGAAVALPIELCRFCLAQVVNPCPPNGFMMDQVNIGGCVTQQDQTVTCCVSGQQNLLCGRAVPLTMM